MTLRALRVAAGLTQEQAGALIHAKRRTWQEWESGRRNMPPAKLELFKLLTEARRCCSDQPNTDGKPPPP